MYSIIVWDTNLYQKTGDGSLQKYQIPMDLARKLINLDEVEYSNLAGLSFDDYDFFSGEQLDLIYEEIKKMSEFLCGFSRELEEMLGLIAYARIEDVSILFDPFRIE